MGLQVQALEQVGTKPSSSSQDQKLPAKIKEEDSGKSEEEKGCTSCFWSFLMSDLFCRNSCRSRNPNSKVECKASTDQRGSTRSMNINAGNVSSQNSVSTTSFTLPATEQSVESDTSARSDSTEANSVISRTEEELLASSHLRRFCFSDLKLATRNFRPDSLLGEGGFGCVFKGWIDEHGTMPMRPGTGLTVAVKTLNHNGLQGHKEWVAEVTFLGQLHHPNLVKLIGFCIEDDHRLLVYEFMQRGSLENHLFRKGSLPLPWNTRMKIALGAAKGVEFLHGGKNPVIYRDFKTSNILLDADYEAKLSDFGLARDGPQGDKSHVSTRVMGTYGYAAPEYVMTGHLSSKSDVYSFGVVLLEMLTGKRSMDKTRPNGQHHLAEWARPYLSDRRRFLSIIDRRLEGHYSIRGAQKAGHLAYKCVSRDPRERPSMSDVVQVLSQLQNLHDLANPAHPPTSSASVGQAFSRPAGDGYAPLR